jgi:hypothetical protein
MINLLPEKNKREITTDYRKRLAAVWLGLLSLVVMVAIVFLLPSYLVTEARLYSAENDTNQKLGSSSQEIQTKEATIAETNRKLELIASRKTAVSNMEALKAVVASRPDGVRLARLSFKQSTSSVAVDVSGTAADREALLQFEQGLRSNNRISAVELPISTLADQVNATFSVSLRVGTATSSNETET